VPEFGEDFFTRQNDGVGCHECNLLVAVVAGGGVGHTSARASNMRSRCEKGRMPCRTTCLHPRLRPSPATAFLTGDLLFCPALWSTGVPFRGPARLSSPWYTTPSGGSTIYSIIVQFDYTGHLKIRENQVLYLIQCAHDAMTSHAMCHGRTGRHVGSRSVTGWGLFFRHHRQRGRGEAWLAPPPSPEGAIYYCMIFVFSSLASTTKAPRQPSFFFKKKERKSHALFFSKKQNEASHHFHDMTTSTVCCSPNKQCARRQGSVGAHPRRREGKRAATRREGKQQAGQS
jgi:hypothetical protein